MKQIELYTGGGVTLSPDPGNGRRLSPYVRLEAENGKGITNGDRITECVAVKATDVDMWSDCDMPDTVDEPTDDLETLKNQMEQIKEVYA